METIFRVVFVYVFVWACFRVLGKRELTQMSPFELVTLLFIPQLFSRALTRQDYSMTNAVIGASTLFLLVFLTSAASYRSGRFARIVEAQPRVLVRHGHFVQEHLDRERIPARDDFSPCTRSGSSASSRWSGRSSKGMGRSHSSPAAASRSPLLPRALCLPRGGRRVNARRSTNDDVGRSAIRPCGATAPKASRVCGAIRHGAHGRARRNRGDSIPLDRSPRPHGERVQDPGTRPSLQAPDAEDAQRTARSRRCRCVGARRAGGAASIRDHHGARSRSARALSPETSSWLRLFDAHVDRGQFTPDCGADGDRVALRDQVVLQATPTSRRTAARDDGAELSERPYDHCDSSGRHFGVRTRARRASSRWRDACRAHDSVRRRLQPRVSRQALGV